MENHACDAPTAVAPPVDSGHSTRENDDDIPSAATSAVLPSVTGTPDTVANILSTIATSMVTLTTLVLTVTTVAVQLAMGQFSPRIVRALLQDRASQLSYGLFASTFTFAMLALREVDAVGGGTVPGLTALVAYLLMLASIVALFLYINHASNSLRAAGLIDLVGDHLREQLDRLYPADAPQLAPRDMVLAREPGLVTDIDRPALVTAARELDCVLELIPMMGDFVPAGAPLFRVHGQPAGKLDREGIAQLVILASERTHDGDPAYGFRKLVDIAERSVATPFADPTTAVMVIDRMHDCLRQLATRTFPSGAHRDANGDSRPAKPATGLGSGLSRSLPEQAGEGRDRTPRTGQSVDHASGTLRSCLT